MSAGYPEVNAVLLGVGVLEDFLVLYLSTGENATTKIPLPIVVGGYYAFTIKPNGMVASVRVPKTYY